MSEANKPEWHAFYDHLKIKAQNNQFQKKLLADPKGVIEREVKKFQWTKPPENFKISIIKQTAPQDVPASDEISIEELNEVVGGIDSYSRSFKLNQAPSYDINLTSSGEHVPGIDQTGINSVTFDYNQGAYTLTNLVNNGMPGKLEIYEDSTIPLNQASVGVAMAGAGTFVREAQPNQHLSFTPHPEYWITFGNYEQGEVLDVTEITDSQKIDSPAGVYSMKVTLNEDNTWTVAPAL